MKKHTRVYLEEMGYISKGEQPIDQPYVPCEVCSQPAVDIHHIDARGMGGSKTKDVIENLMALCRTCHDKYGDKVQFKDWLKGIHQKIVDRLCKAA